MKRNNRKTAGELIKELRKAKGLSQMKLAELLDISYQQIQKYEKGASSISIERLKQIANALGAPVSLFFSPEKSLVSETSAVYGKMTDDELLLLQLFRGIKDKRLKNAVLEFLKALQK